MEHAPNEPFDSYTLTYFDSTFAVDSYLIQNNSIFYTCYEYIIIKQFSLLNVWVQMSININ